MNIHEYQAKELLAKYGVPVPAGHAAMSVDEAVEAAKQLPGPLWVVKAQIHAGGRGKGKFKELGLDAKGGVRLARSIDEVRDNAAEMLGKTLVTIQTGSAGKQVQRLYITDGVDIAKEYYLALLVDRETGRIAVVASTEGGMDIETVAHETPEKIRTAKFDKSTPLQSFIKTISHKDLSQDAASHIAQIRLAHLPVNQYLKRIGWVDMARCPACGIEEEMAEHFLLHCPGYMHERWALAQQAQKKRKRLCMKTLLSTPELIVPLANYINTTNRFKAIEVEC